MRWGHRRGGVTPIGPKKGFIKKASVSQLNGAREISSKSSDIAREGGNINRTISRMRAEKKREDIGTLSDDELRAKVNRMNLEQQYSNLSSNQISRGQEHARNALELTGSVLAVGASAAAILLAAKQLKG